MRTTACVSFFLVLGIVACGGADKVQDGKVEPPSPPPEAAPVEARPVAERGPTVVFLGDSLTAGFGIAAEDAFPAVLERRFASEGIALRVVNAGISGDTTAGGLGRLDWLLSQEPEIVVVALGANDGLRGMRPADTEANLRLILRKVRDAGAETLLLGILVPPNYGPDFSEEFAALFPRLAEEEDVPLVPFLLEGVAGDPELNLGDGVHPNAAGYLKVADVVYPELRRLVEEIEDGG